MLIRARLTFLSGLFFLGCFFSACKKTDADEVITHTDVATKWADLTLDIIKNSIYKSPTYSSRSLGYMGLTMYETIVHADATNRSLAGQLNGLSSLPSAEADAEYNWLLALNAGQQTMLKLLYPRAENISEDNFARIDALYNNLLTNKGQGISQAVIDRSVKFGQ